MDIVERIQRGGWYVKCQNCNLPQHPGLNCEAENRRLMDWARVARDDSEIPYAGYPGFPRTPIDADEGKHGG